MSQCNCSNNNTAPRLFGLRHLRYPKAPVAKCDACGVLFTTVVIPAGLGTSAKGQPYAPKDGNYFNKLVRYEADKSVWIYDSAGVYSNLKEAQ